MPIVGHEDTFEQLRDRYGFGDYVVDQQRRGSTAPHIALFRVRLPSDVSEALDVLARVHLTTRRLELKRAGVPIKQNVLLNPPCCITAYGFGRLSQAYCPSDCTGPFSALSIMNAASTILSRA